MPQMPVVDVQSLDEVKYEGNRVRRQRQPAGSEADLRAPVEAAHRQLTIVFEELETRA